MFRTRSLGFITLAAGVLLVIAVLGYVAFAGISRGKSDQFTANLSEDERVADFVAPKPTPGSAVEEPSGPVPGVEQFASLFPGSQVNPRYWDDPAWAGPEPFGGPRLPDDYELTVRPGWGLPPGSVKLPTRIRVPSVGMDEVVEELDLVIDDELTRYEQPINIVGHIRGTVNPGENGNGWYFGHQSNFGSSEGAVFQRLPELFDQFRKDPVFVFIDTADESFAYRVYGTDVVDREDLRLTPSDGSTVTLVTSWPPLVFNQRFLVFAELVGIKRIGTGL